MTLEQAGILVAIFVAFAAPLISYGYNKRRMEQLESDVKRSLGHHTDHFNSFREVNNLLLSEAEILAIINGKYVRSSDLVRLENIVERFRKWREHDYANDRATCILTAESQRDLRVRVERLEGKAK